jgi:hypothetical protein
LSPGLWVECEVERLVAPAFLSRVANMPIAIIHLMEGETTKKRHVRSPQ